MAKPRWYDWVGALAAWTTGCFVGGVFMAEGIGAPEEFVVTTFLLTWVGGVVAARVWWLRRAAKSADAARDHDGLTTGEMTAQRLELMEQRIYELEERLDLTERLLAEARERPRIARSREDTPV